MKPESDNVCCHKAMRNKTKKRQTKKEEEKKRRHMPIIQCDLQVSPMY